MLGNCARLARAILCIDARERPQGEGPCTQDCIASPLQAELHSQHISEQGDAKNHDKEIIFLLFSPQVPKSLPGGAPLALWRWDSGKITREQFNSVPHDLRTPNGGACAQCVTVQKYKVSLPPFLEEQRQSLIDGTRN